MDQAINFWVVGCIIVVLFVIGREIVCWYWKLNKIVKLLESIEQKLINGKQ